MKKRELKLEKLKESKVAEDEQNWGKHLDNRFSPRKDIDKYQY